MADLANLRINVDSRAVREAISDLAGLGREADNAGRSSSNLATAMQTLTKSLAALGIGAMVVEMIKFGAQFEKSIAEISTLVDTTIVSVDELSVAVRNQATAFGGDVQTQAKALYQIISAGASDAATANNILTTSNKLAVGGVTDVATAADGLTSVLNAYGDKVAGATAVSDAMFIAMKAGKTTIGELSSSIGGVAPLAAQMGISFDELAASTAALTKGGVSTSVAMTGLRAILATIAKPSKEATDLAAELGIQFNSAGLKAKGLAGFMEDLKQKTGGNSDAMATLFGGVEALVPALALAGKAGEDLAVIMGQMAAKSGASDEAFGKMAQTFDFQFAKAIANINDRILSLGLLIQSTLLPVLTFFNNNLSAIENTLRTLTFALGGAAAAFFALKVAMGVQAIVGFIVQVYALVAGMGLANFATVAATFAINAFKAALASTGIGIVVVAIGALVGAMYSLSAAQAQARAETNALVGSLAGLAAARAANYGTELAKAKEKVKELQKERDDLQAEADRTDAARSARFGIRPTDIKGGTSASKEVADLTKNIKEQNAAIANSEVVYKLANEEAKKTAELAKQNGGAVVASTNAEKDKTKETAKSTDALMDYYKGLVETGKYLGLTTEYEIQAAKATADGRVELAAKIIMQGKANEAAQLLIDNEKKRQDFIKGTLADLQFENSLIGMGVQEREKAIAMRALENAKIAEGTDAYKAYLAAIEKSSNAKISSEQDKRIAALREEITLMGLSAEAATVQAAKYAALAAGLKEGTDAYAQFLAKAAEEAGLQKTVDGLQAIKDAMQEVKDMTFDIDLEGVFGNVGKAVGGLVNVYDDFAERQKVLALAMSKDNKDEAGRRMAQQKSFRNEINLYGNLAASAKGFFKEKSVGYKVMQAAETAFRAFELVMAAKSAAVKIGLVASTTGAVVAGAATETAATAAAEAAKTGTTLAGTAARIVAKIAEGAASMFASLGPLGFAAVAAMVGVMASFGFSGGGSRTPPKYNTGTGTVMGDPSAQSESLTKSIERLAEIDQLTMRYSAQMASSLKSIEANIGGLTSLLVRTGDISASGAGVKTGTSGIGDINKTLGGLISQIPVLGTVFGGLLSAVGSVVNALFGTKTSIVGQGLSAVAQTMADIVSLGFEAQNFTNVQRKSRFLGVTVRTRYSTETTEASDEVNRQFTLILKGFYDAISAASNPLGLALNDVQERLNNFVVNIGQIDLQGLTGQEIQEKLTAVFGAAADSMARAAITGLDDFQKVGEGYFETIVRVASGVEQAQQFLRQLGVEAIAYTDILNKQGDVTAEIIRQSVMLNDASAGIAGGFAEIIGNATGTGQELYDLVLTLRDLQQQISATGQKAEYMTIAMISAAGGLDAFQSGLQSFYDDILTDSERSAIELARLTAQFQSLGVAMPASREAFKTLIQSIDITTAAGQALYGSLIALTPAFVDLIENTNAAGEQIELSNQRRELEIQLMEAQGNAAGALAARRELELAALDETLRSLQQQIWAAEDARAASQAAEQAAKAAADAAAKIATERTNLEIQLMEALGNSSDALAARRALELAATDESNRALLRQIYTAQDATKAAQELATAQAAQAALARQRQDLEIQLMDALGNSTGALAARRELELAGMDESLRALQRQIWAAEDARAASDAATEAAKLAAEEQARALEAATALNRQRRELEIELLEAQGFAVQALAARRALELEGMDASLRALQEQIYAAEAKAEEDAKAAKAAEDAANAMQKYQDALASVTQTVIDEINRLRGINASSSSVLLKAQFATLTAQARTGNLDALGKLPELSRSIEEATLGTATSALEVARIRAWLAASLSETLAVQTASNAQVSTTGAGLTFDGNNTASANAEQTSGDLSNMGNMLYNAMYQVAKNTGKSYELLDRWDGDGLPDIREDASDYY